MDDEHDNEMERRRAEAWAEYANGTFSESDRKIFNRAFEYGWNAHINKVFADFKHKREIDARSRRVYRR